MAAFLGNLRNVVIAGFVLALLVLVIHWTTQRLEPRCGDLCRVPDPLGAHHLRRDVDRPALVLQLRRDADHAENPR